jgi:hypothetical protein
VITRQYTSLHVLWIVWFVSTYKKKYIYIHGIKKKLKWSQQWKSDMPKITTMPRAFQAAATITLISKQQLFSCVSWRRNIRDFAISWIIYPTNGNILSTQLKQSTRFDQNKVFYFQSLRSFKFPLFQCLKWMFYFVSKLSLYISFSLN